MKKIIAIVLCVALLAAFMAVSASAFDAADTNTRLTYLPIFEDFFNLDGIFDLLYSIFSFFGLSI